LEWIIIAVIALMIFGTGRLGEVGGALGKSIREFNRAVREVSRDSATRKLAVDHTGTGRRFSARHRAVAGVYTVGPDMG
jgi:sec-independent protein translocase protein TatA